MSARYAGRRLLALIPHPDDEAYGMGGLLRLSSDGGAEVQVVCATRGEGGADWGAGASPRDLASVRTEELIRSCVELGAERPRFLDFPDGGVAGVPRGLAIAAIVGILRDVQPHVVVTLGPDGAYGHADHLATWELARLAIAAAAAGEGPDANTRLIYAAFAPDFFLPQWRRAAGGGDPAIVGATPPRLGTREADVQLRLDIRRVAERKLAAIAAHRSQLRDGGARSLFPDGLVDGLLAEEWFVSALGPPLRSGAAGPFDGLAE